METLQTNKSTVVVDDFGRWMVAYGKEAPTVGNPHIGAKYFDTDDKKEYYWTGSGWAEVPSNPNFNVEYWEDLRFPAQGINPLGSTAPPGISNVTGMLEFSGTVNNIVTGIAQMPHSWLRGSAIYPHIHVIATTSNGGTNSRWQLEYNLANNQETFVNAYGSYTNGGIITVANPASASELLKPAGWTAIDMSAYRESCCMLWRITRLAASDAADNDANVWVLCEFDIHYQIGKTGTLDRIPN